MTIAAKRQPDADGRLVAAPTDAMSPEARARAGLDAIAAALRAQLSDVQAIVAAIDALPDEERWPWRTAVADRLRAVSPRSRSWPTTPSNGRAHLP